MEPGMVFWKSGNAQGCCGMTEQGIFRTLEALGLASLDTRELYAEGTRDATSLAVYRDRVSGVVYIDGFYTGDQTYERGDYRQETIGRAGQASFEEHADAARRISSFRHLYSGRTIADFGCGEGDFLRGVKLEAASCTGIELQKDAVAKLRQDGINCFQSLEELDAESMDAIFSFHVLEHLPNPLEILAGIQSRLKPGGRIVIEVPHANDFLLSQVHCEAFKNFTLWSQHLVLHTRESLRRVFEFVGFREIVIEGVQRYPLSNHFGWMSNGRPGGHKSHLAALETPELESAYRAALARIDATDTLILTASR